MCLHFNHGTYAGSFTPSSPPPPPPLSQSASSREAIHPHHSSKIPSHYEPLWSQTGFLTDLYVYVSEEPIFNSFSDESQLVWKESSIIYGNLNDVRTKDVEIPISSVSSNIFELQSPWSRLTLFLECSKEWIIVCPCISHLS